jgi:hypothetical protein
MNTHVFQTSKLTLRYKDKIALDALTLNVARGGIRPAPAAPTPELVKYLEQNMKAGGAL